MLFNSSKTTLVFALCAGLCGETCRRCRRASTSLCIFLFAKLITTSATRLRRRRLATCCRRRLVQPPVNTQTASVIQSCVVVVVVLCCMLYACMCAISRRHHNLCVSTLTPVVVGRRWPLHCIDTNKRLSRPIFTLHIRTCIYTLHAAWPAS